jgi:hypothetical protein
MDDSMAWLNVVKEDGAILVSVADGNASTAIGQLVAIVLVSSGIRLGFLLSYVPVSVFPFASASGTPNSLLCQKEVSSYCKRAFLHP